VRQNAPDYILEMLPPAREILTKKL